MKSVFAFLAALVAAFLLAGCATAPAKSGPTMVMRQGNNTLTLMTTPCLPKVADMLKPEYVPQFKAAIAVVGGADLRRMLDSGKPGNHLRSL